MYQGAGDTVMKSQGSLSSGGRDGESQQARVHGSTRRVHERLLRGGKKHVSLELDSLKGTSG